MNKLILLSFMMFSCASFTDEAALKTLASFDLKCLPEEIEAEKINDDYVEAHCDGRSEKYFRKCIKNNKCHWVKVQRNTKQ